jgi:hypothetical protein
MSHTAALPDKPMNSRCRLFAFGANTLTVALLAAGCGSYDNNREPPATGGTSTGGTSTGGTSTGGTSTGGMSTGGTSTGGTSTGGTSTGGTSAGGGSGGSAGETGAKASCTNVAACGGDVVGTWTVSSSCLPVSGKVDVSGFGLGCLEAPVEGMLQVTGTWTAKADGTFSDETTTSGEQVFAVPPSCLNVSGVTTTCDRVGGPFQALGFSSVVCVPDAATGGCTCTATADQMGGMALISLERPTEGNYTAASNVITTSGMLDMTYDYCVAGSTMTTSVTTVGKAGTVSGTIVLQKQ